MATIKDKLGGWLGKMRQNNKPVRVDVQRGEGEEQPPQNKDVSIAQLKQGYSEVVETMQSVRKHLETQGQRSERMMEMFEGMPEILKSIPETNRAQVRLLEAIHANLDRQNETSSELSGAIQGLTKAADTQQNTMTKIQEHLRAEDVARRELQTGVDTLNTTLDGVKESNESARATLSTISDQAAMREQRLVEMFERSRKTQTMMTIVAWVLALAALCVAFYVAVQATRMQAATPIAVTPPAEQVVDPTGAAVTEPAGVDASTAEPAASEATPAEVTEPQPPFGPASSDAAAEPGTAESAAEPTADADAPPGGTADTTDAGAEVPANAEAGAATE